MQKEKNARKKKQGKKKARKKMQVKKKEKKDDEEDEEGCIGRRGRDPFHFSLKRNLREKNPETLPQAHTSPLY